MGKLKYLCLHCSDTPPSMTVTRGMLEQWHLGPRDLDGGRVRYKGRNYPSRKALPDELLGGVPIAKIQGRGWDRLGYYAIIHRDGEKEVLTPNNLDREITRDEMTWGAAGINTEAIHVVLEGGKGPLMTFDYHFTAEQEKELLAFCRVMILRPPIFIIGHNQVVEKNCPGFVVYDWLMDHSIESWGIKKKRI